MTAMEPNFQLLDSIDVKSFYVDGNSFVARASLQSFPPENRNQVGIRGHKNVPRYKLAWQSSSPFDPN